MDTITEGDEGIIYNNFEEKMKTIPSFSKYSSGKIPESPTEPAPQRIISSAKSAQIQTFQGEVSPDRYGIQGVYRTGAHSVIYRAIDLETGRTVAIKKHEHYLPQEGGDAKEIREAEDRFRREAQILAKLNHPGIVDAYGYFFKEDDFKRKPFLVTELIERDSLEEMIQQGKTFNEDEARQVVLSVGVPIHYLHTANGRPIIHRDLKPDNVKVMPEDALWPHKIVDFSESKIGKATMSGSVTGTIGYNAPEIYGGGIADQSADFYSLARIAAHMLIGDNRRFMETWFGNTSLREMKEQGDLNISDKFLEAIERATARDPSHRYKTLADIAKDLGYDLKRIPQTRQELGAILGHKSLPVQIEPERREVAKKSSSSLPRVIDNYNGTFSIEGFRDISGGEVESWHEFKIEKTPYETLKSLRRDSYQQIIGGLMTIHGGVFEIMEKARAEATLAYARHVAPQFPAIHDALEGKRTLEDALREKAPSFFNLLKNAFTGNLVDPTHISSLTDVRNKYQDEKADYLERRRKLCEILGEDPKNNLLYNRAGLGLGGAAGIISSLAIPYFFNLGLLSDGLMPIAWAAGNVAISSVIGERIGNGVLKRKLKKKAREVDSWIKEARETLNPKPKGLEEKVENVELTREEKERIESKSSHYSSFLPLGLASLGVITSYLHIPKEIPSFILTSSITMLFEKSAFRDYFTKRKLKQKRLTAGLDEDGMKKYIEFTVSSSRNFPSQTPKLDELLSDNSLRKKLGRKKFTGNGVKVEYKKLRTRGVIKIIKVAHPADFYNTSGTRVKISATPENMQRVVEICSDIDEHYHIKDAVGEYIQGFSSISYEIDPLQPFPAGTILSDGTKMPDVRARIERERAIEEARRIRNSGF